MLGNPSQVVIGRFDNHNGLRDRSYVLVLARPHFMACVKIKIIEMTLGDEKQDSLVKDKEKKILP
jgi:hypothetical protein